MKKRTAHKRHSSREIRHTQTQVTPAQNAGYRIAILSFFALFLILILAGFVFMIASFSKPYSSVELSGLPKSGNSTFLFPTSNDSLIKGMTYTLKWQGGPPTIEGMLLVNKALQKDGVSVAIAEKAVNATNTGSYEFTVPTTIPDGLYRIEAGPLTSDYFEITSR